MHFISRRALSAALLLAIAACGDSATTTAAAPDTIVSTTHGVSTTTSSAPPTTPTTVAPTTVATTTTSTTEGGPRLAQDGDLVSVHYTGTLDDGEQFDSSIGSTPLEFVVGSGQVISGFDDAVRGLAVGESRTVRILPENAYGKYNPELVLEFPIESAPEGLQVGDQVTFSNGAPGVVLEVTETVVRVDANHRLAGQALTFEVELVSIG